MIGCVWGKIDWLSGIVLWICCGETFPVKTGSKITATVCCTITAETLTAETSKCPQSRWAGIMCIEKCVSLVVNTSMVTNISCMPKPMTSVWQLSVFMEGFTIKANKKVTRQLSLFLWSATVQQMDWALLSVRLTHRVWDQRHHWIQRNTGSWDQQCTCSEI